MRQDRLFEVALGLSTPWEVAGIEFCIEKKRLDIHIDFPRGSTFLCPECDAPGAKPYDTSVHTWRHLDFFQHQAYLHARVPRVQCPQDCGVKKVEVPWARSGSGFTLLFEALVMALAREMPVAVVAAIIGEHDTRVWRIVHHYVDQAREDSDFSEVEQVAVDETASRRGHNYIGSFFDSDDKRLLYAVEGRDQKTVEAFAEDLSQHGGDPNSIDQICCDMSPAYIAGVGAHLPNAEITFDRFHIMKIMNDAVDRVRRVESKDTHLLRRTRYYWLKNPENLTAAQRKKMASLTKHNLKTARAYQIRLTLREFFDQPDRAAGENFLKRWYFWATHSRLQPVIEAARTIKRHWEGVLNWFNGRLTTGLLEGFNSLLQAAKARARGYRTNRNLITMAYLIGGKLNYGLPT